MPLIRWDPAGKEVYTMFTGVITIDPEHSWRDEAVNTWVVAMSPNAEAAIALLPRCPLPKVLRVQTGKEEGLLVATPLNPDLPHDQAVEIMVQSVKLTMYGEDADAKPNVRFTIVNSLYFDDRREHAIIRESELNV